MNNWKDLFPKQNRFFETKNGILFCGNCLEIMKNFPKESVNLILTDPPYNIADSNKLTKVGNRIKTNNEAWGNKFKDKWSSIEEYFNWLKNNISEMSRVLNRFGNLILFLDRNYIGFFIYKIEQELNLKFRNKIYFEKLNPLPHFRKTNYRSCIEEAVWFTKTFKSDYYINFVSQQEMKQIFRGNIGKKFSKHPTEKYEWMIEPLIIRHSKENDLVLDPFAGSGTVLVIAEKLNRKWIGIEINEEYCEIIKERILKVIDKKGNRNYI
jgi:DNA modification methylase